MESVFRFLRVGLIAAVACVPAAWSQNTQADSQTGQPVTGDAAEQAAERPVGLTTTAEFACILDLDTGLVLYGKNADVPMIPASLTKIMTAYMVFEAIEAGDISLRRRFRVSRDAWERGGARDGGSTSFLEPGSLVAVEDLLRGMIVQSGNDAAIVLAEGIAGSEEAFAREMTARARELELFSANFTSATGLYDDRHRISAIDLARLTAHMIETFPQYYHYFGETEFIYGGIRQPNRNPLLGTFPGADGVKTGHLNISGYGIVGSATRDGVRRVMVLNGLRTRQGRANEARRVMRQALDNFRIRQIVGAGAKVGTADVWLGQTISVPLIAMHNGVIGMHVSAISAMSATITYDGPLVAPLSKGQIVGALQVSVPGADTVTVPIAVGQDIPRLNLIQRAVLGMAGAR